MSNTINDNETPEFLPSLPSQATGKKKASPRTPTESTPLLDASTELGQQAHEILSAIELTLGQVNKDLTHIRSTMKQTRHHSKDTLSGLRHLGEFDDRIVATSDRPSTSRSDTPEQKIWTLESQINRLATEVEAQNASPTTENKIAPSQYKVTLLLLALTHFVIWVAVIALNLHPVVRNHWLIMLRLVRSPLLLVTWIYLFGVNMTVWTASDVNYVDLLQLPRSFLTPQYIFGVGGVISLLFAVFLSCFLFLISAMADNSQSWVMMVGLLFWIFLMVYLLNPFSVFCRSERFTFLNSLGRTYMSPFFKVRFADAWLADQLVSLSIIMLDLEYLICYCTGGGWTGSVTDQDTRLCTTNAYYIRPIITVLPTTFRYLQCLRCYVDTMDVKHLWNALKYFTTYPVVFFATIYRPKTRNWLFSFSEFDFDFDDGIVFVLWALSALFNAVYSFVWDVVFDWELLSFKHKSLSYRSQRLYRPTCWYSLAMAADFLFRFLWALKITLAVLYHENVDIVFTAFAFAEIFRRFFWNFIRFETQWIKTKE